MVCIEDDTLNKKLKFTFTLQMISDGYAAHLNHLVEPGAMRPATGNARLFLRKSCFRLPQAGDSKKAAKRTVSYPGSSAHKGECFRLPNASPGPTQILVPEISSCVSGEGGGSGEGDDSYGGGAARARGKSPMAQKGAGSRTTTV
jgi:hypothetical protein